jgi:hypothetical protein
MRTRPVPRLWSLGRVVGVIGRLGMRLGVLLVGASVLLAPAPVRLTSDLVSASGSVQAAQLGWSGHRLAGQLGGSQARWLGHHRSRRRGSAVRPPVEATAVVAGISDIADIGVAQTEARTASAAGAVAPVWVMAPKLISGLRARWTSLSHQLARVARLGTMLVTPSTHRRTRTSAAATDDIGPAVLDHVSKGPSVSPGQALTPAYQCGRGRLFATSSTRPD